MWTVFTNYSLDSEHLIREVADSLVDQISSTKMVQA
jgi:hypothetical protein